MFGGYERDAGNGIVGKLCPVTLLDSVGLVGTLLRNITCEKTAKMSPQVRFDSLSQKERSERMSRIHGKDTKPELIVRRLTWALGYRYRLHAHRLPGCPDLVFSSRKKVIFVHGCFWHQHRGCRQYRMPKSRLDFWLPKLQGNRERDRVIRTKLRGMGWRILVIWECELKNTTLIARRIEQFLEGVT